MGTLNHSITQTLLNFRKTDLSSYEAEMIVNPFQLNQCKLKGLERQQEDNPQKGEWFSRWWPQNRDSFLSQPVQCCNANAAMLCSISKRTPEMAEYM